MSLEVNGVVPTEIKHCGVSITDLSIDGVGVWGKPYTLHYETNSTYTIKVTRIESPYQNASLGELSTGSIVYYGDKLTIIAERTSGYYLTGWTINDYNYTTNDNTTRLERDWIVDSAVTISATTKSAASWHEVYTGSSLATFGVGSTSLKTVSFVPSLTVPNNSTKIRASYQVGGNAGSGTGTTEISVSSGNGKSSNLSKNTSKVPELYIKSESYSVKAEGKAASTISVFTITVTKLEAYY